MTLHAQVVIIAIVLAVFTPLYTRFGKPWLLIPLAAAGAWAGWLVPSP